MNDQPAVADPESGPVKLRLAGEYDISRREELEQLLAPAYGARAAVIDVSDVTYFDSTALTCLIRLRKRMMEGGSANIRIVGAKPQIRRIFTLTNLERVFELED